ncbi:MAG: CYTH domain-containing protein [Micromonosporaceae bacterium]|nr:CYTH domain-containing protein [Micromonosporaceae bacterium]
MPTTDPSPQPAVTAICEIEVKYQVDDLVGLEGALSGRGIVLSAPSAQDDQAYAPTWWNYGQSKLGVPFARLRTQNGRHLFTVKTPLANEQACAEQETLVDDRDQMHQALLAMGFQSTVRIVKTRRTARSGRLGLCVDEVEHVGVFLEVELIAPAGGDGLAAQAELDGFVAALGVPVRRVMDTYDSLVRDAQSVCAATSGVPLGCGR